MTASWPAFSTRSARAAASWARCAPMPAVASGLGMEVLFPCSWPGQPVGGGRALCVVAGCYGGSTPPRPSDRSGVGVEAAVDRAGERHEAGQVLGLGVAAEGVQ